MSRAKHNRLMKALVVAMLAFVPTSGALSAVPADVLDIAAEDQPAATLEADTLDEFAITPDSVLLRRETEPSAVKRLSPRDSAAVHLADSLASKESFAREACMKRTESGRRALTALTRFFGGIGFERLKCATKPRAWTPASVRDEP